MPNHSRQRDPASVRAGSTRAVGYLRVSTAGQAERGMGLASQRDRVEAFAAVRGLDLVDVVQEAASGGVKSGEELSYEHRPVLLSLLERAERGEYSALIVAKFDRLSRDYATLIVLERRLQRLGVQLHSADEENGDGAIAEFIRGQLALVAQLERAMILDRVSSGKAKGKQAGKHVHGRIPYGYQSSSGTLTPDESIAPKSPNPSARVAVVRRIFAGIKQGDSPGRVARALNSEGIPGPDGPTWSATAVRRIVGNDVYAGVKYGVKRAHPSIVSRRMLNDAQRALQLRAANRRGDVRQ